MDRIVFVLEQIRAGFVSQSVHGFSYIFNDANASDRFQIEEPEDRFFKHAI